MKIDNYFPIEREYFSAGEKYGWQGVGIGLHKGRIDRLAKTDLMAEITYGEMKKRQIVNPKYVKGYPVERTKDGTKLYIIPVSILKPKTEIYYL